MRKAKSVAMGRSKESRRARALTRLSPARKDPAMRRFEANVGRGELQQALDGCLDPRVKSLLATMADPAYQAFSFGQVCVRSGLALHEVIEHYRTAKVDEGLLLMSRHMPDLMEDLALDGKSRLRICEPCGGNGRTPGPAGRPIKCRNCDGTGKVRVPGDADACKLALEVNGLVGRRGPLIQQQINVGGDQLASLEDTSKYVQAIAQGEDPGPELASRVLS